MFGSDGFKAWMGSALLGLVTVVASGQTGPGSAQYELASMREDVRWLQQRVGELGILVEQLVRENREMKTRLADAERAYVTVDQLNRAVSSLQQSLQNAQASQRREIVDQVTAEVEKLARQTQTAIDALAKSVNARASATPPVTASFSDDYPREGITYTVQSGDSLSAIARRFNSTVRDIQNANRIADPTRLQVGQVLFIPQRKE